jgi:hypothetical protein
VKCSVVSGSNAPPLEPAGDAAVVGVGVSIELGAGELLTVAAALGGEPLPQALSATTVANAAIKRMAWKRWREAHRYAPTVRPPGPTYPLKPAEARYLASEILGALDLTTSKPRHLE